MLPLLIEKLQQLKGSMVKFRTVESNITHEGSVTGVGQDFIVILKDTKEELIVPTRNLCQIRRNGSIAWNHPVI